MFCSQRLLSKKGPLGPTWVAAYSFRKLRKDRILSENVSSCVDRIFSEVEIPLRILAQLLLGLVRIFSKKVDFLYDECTKALSLIPKVLPSSSRVSCKRVASLSSKASKNCHKITKTTKRGTTKITTDAQGADNVVQNAIDTQISSPEEPMFAPYNRVTITIPDNLALDSFEMEVPEECDADEASHHVLVEGDEDDWRPPSVLDEHRNVEMHFGFSFAYATPVRDVFSNDMMDLRFEMSELHQLNVPEARQLFRDDLTPSIENGGTNARAEEPANIGTAGPEEPANITVSDKTQMVSDQRIDSVILPEAERRDFQENTPTKRKLRPRLLAKPHVKLSEQLASPDFAVQTPAKRQLRARMPAKTHAKPSRSASPEFTVETPSKREQRQVSRKRCLFDEIIVLPNETLRNSIHDSSSLVSKRMKAPHTSLGAWKAYIFSDLHKAFMEPLFPLVRMESKCSLRLSETKTETATTDNPQAAEPLHLSPDHRTSLHDNITDFPESTGPMEIEGTVKSHERPEVSLASKSHERPEVSLASAVGASDIELELMDISSPDEGTSNSVCVDVISTRTRSVARYLSRASRNQSKRHQHEGLSLSNILKGRNRTACSRFFYETLVLKTQDFVEVKQQTPYADINISPGAKLRNLSN